MPRQKPSEEVLTGLNRLDLPNITDSLNKQAEIIREAERAEKEKRAKEALDKELLTNDSLNKKSLDKDSLNNESLEQESLYKDSLDKESLTVGPLVFGDFGTLDSLDTKDSLVQKETSITKDSLVQNPPTTVEPLVKESLYKESFVEEAADATVLTTDSICKAVQYVLSEQSLTPPARIILSYLLLKQKKYKLFFTYKMLTDGLAFSAPTISSALDSLRSHDYLDVITIVIGERVLIATDSFIRNRVLKKIQYLMIINILIF